MTLWLWASLLAGQSFDSNFDRMVQEINRYRFDRALEELLPVQGHLREKSGGKLPEMDAGLVSRMREMGSPPAVLSAVALLRRHVEREEYAEAHFQAILAGLGLSALWSEMPAFRRLDFLREDLRAAQGAAALALRKKVGYVAVEAREWDLALELAKGLEAEAKHTSWTIRGLVALAGGDEGAAEKALLESMKGVTGLAMRDGGPNLLLANQMLQFGKKQVVGEFLKLVEASVWRNSQQAMEWRTQLEAGKEVDFGRWNGVN
jgi:hypothetical protein